MENGILRTSPVTGLGCEPGRIYCPELSIGKQGLIQKIGTLTRSLTTPSIDPQRITVLREKATNIDVLLDVAFTTFINRMKVGKETNIVYGMLNKCLPITLNEDSTYTLFNALPGEKRRQETLTRENLLPMVMSYIGDTPQMKFAFIAEFLDFKEVSKVIGKGLEVGNYNIAFDTLHHYYGKNRPSNTSGLLDKGLARSHEMIILVVPKDTAVESIDWDHIPHPVIEKLSDEEVDQISGTLLDKIVEKF